MAPPRKYSVELQQRATRMALDARKDPETSRGAIRRVADQLEVHPEALHNWVRHAEVDDGLRPGITTDDQARITELEREVRGPYVVCQAARAAGRQSQSTPANQDLSTR